MQASLLSPSTSTNTATMKNQAKMPTKENHTFTSNAPSNIKNDNKRKRNPTKQKHPALATSTPPKEPQTICDIEDLSLFTKEDTQQIRTSLLGWYDVSQRDLPWRKRSDLVSDTGERKEEEERRAYGIWVSEVMLQQTRVQTVIDYYNRWMLKWPSLEDLASASLEEVNELWAGLGYYRRARFLLEGAKMIVAGGEGFPRTVADLRKVPGIGDYTAGAIASIAFREVVPVVDGNVVRVLARLKALSANPKDSATVKQFWKLAGQLVDPSRPGDFNQSLMELGATICTPLSPSCSTCPISSQCLAYSISQKDKSKSVTDFPAKVVKTKQRHDFSAVCVVEVLHGKDTSEMSQSESGFLLVKRPDEGLLAGLWEFPSIMLNKEADTATRRKAVDNYLKQSFGLDSKSCKIVFREDIGDFLHIFSHIRLKIFAELLVVCPKDGLDFLSKQRKENMVWKFVDSKDISTMGLTSGVRKVYNMVQKYKQKNSSLLSVGTRTRRNSNKRLE